MINPNDPRFGGLPRLFARAGPFPRHIGVIMDGNRHYGRDHDLTLEEAYERGSETFQGMIEFCFATGVKAMTFYAFSIANFQRSNREVEVVMRLIQRACSQLIQPGGIAERFGMRIRLCGKKSLLPAELVRAIEHAEKILDTNANNANCILNICIAYGSRDEITSSVRAAVAKHSYHGKTGNSEHMRTPHSLAPRRITVEALDDEMFTSGCPPMDLLVRTSGTNRLSDFMLWQCHRDTEIVIIKENWPDLTVWNFIQAISPWLLRASMSNFITSVRKTPSVLSIATSFWYMVFILLMKAYNSICWYFHIVCSDKALMVREEEVSLDMIQLESGRLKKLPTHLSVIISLTADQNAFEMAVSAVADLMILCITAGIPLLSVYEKTGSLKSHKDVVHQLVATRLSYHNGGQRHNFNVLVSGIGRPTVTDKCGPAAFSLLLLSAQDSRESLAEICNVMERSIRQSGTSPVEIDVAQIEKMLKSMLLASLDDSSTEKSSHPNESQMTIDPKAGPPSNNRNTLDKRALDPDVLFVFGPKIQFDGYPPWQLATPEIFCVDDNSAGFGRRGRSFMHQIFLQGLHKYAGADIRLGR